MSAKHKTFVWVGFYILTWIRTIRNWALLFTSRVNGEFRMGGAGSCDTKHQSRGVVGVRLNLVEPAN